MHATLCKSLLNLNCSNEDENVFHQIALPPPINSSSFFFMTQAHVSLQQFNSSLNFLFCFKEIIGIPLEPESRNQ